MRIGYVQFAPVIGDLEANRRAVERLAEKAARMTAVSSAASAIPGDGPAVDFGANRTFGPDTGPAPGPRGAGEPHMDRAPGPRGAGVPRKGADLLVFPELSSSGYHFRSREEAWEASESAENGPFVRLLADLSARHRMYLVGGFCERSGERLYNSAVVVGPAGVVGLYRKAHLFLNEKDIFVPGDVGLPVFDLDLSLTSPVPNGTTCRIGLLICFDWQFPEVWRVLALKGAEVICHPSNLVLPARAQRAVPVHAMLNRVFVILSNRIGVERGLTFTGGSVLADPSGNVLADSPPGDEDIRLADVDLAEARDKMVTARNDLIADRRPELYSEILRQPEDGIGRRRGR